ncbi:hypothetical protein ACWGLF_27705 [Streptomyces puniciscabiei]
MRAGVVGAEVHLREALGRDLLELLLGGALFPPGEDGREGLGDVADPGVVGRARSGGEREAGPG